MDAIIITLVALSCMGIGLSIGWLFAKNKLGTELVEIRAHAAAREQAFDEKSELLKDQMENVATRVSQQNSETFLQLAEERLGKVQTEAAADADARKKEVEDLVNPIKDHLSKLEKATTEMEKNREGAYQGLKRTVEGLQKQTIDLRDTNV